MVSSLLFFCIIRYNNVTFVDFRPKHLRELNIWASREVNMQSLTVVMLDRADLNRDGVINALDLGWMALDWLDCTHPDDSSLCRDITQ